MNHDKIRRIADRLKRNIRNREVGVDGRTRITLAGLKDYDHESALRGIEEGTGRPRDTWTEYEWEHIQDSCTARLTAIRELEEEGWED